MQPDQPQCHHSRRVQFDHRLGNGPNAVPEISDGCFGTLTVTSVDQPIEAFV
jgi:hypothetical protein